MARWKLSIALVVTLAFGWFDRAVAEPGCLTWFTSPNADYQAGFGRRIAQNGDLIAVSAITTAPRSNG